MDLGLNMPDLDLVFIEWVEVVEFGLTGSGVGNTEVSEVRD